MSVLKSVCEEVSAETSAVRAFRPSGSKAGGMPSIGAEFSDKFSQRSWWSHQRRAPGYKYGLRHWGYVCANHIAKRVAGQPILAATKVADPGQAGKHLVGKKSLDLMPSQVKLTTLIGDDEALEYIKSGTLHDLLQYPNPVQTRFDFTYSAVMSMLLTGEAYFIHDLDKGTKKPQVWAIPTDSIVPKHEGGLFTGYLLRANDTEEGVPIDPENVERVYFADPSNLRSCVSPLMTQLEALLVDGYIQNSQKNSFQNGIFPGVMITVGRVGGKSTGPRKALQAHQRRQLFESARRIWGGVGRTGEPLIVDALIEDVKPFTMNPREMDWNSSGSNVKERIFQSLSLNPVSVGALTGANRAQAIVAEENQCTNVLNPILTQLSLGLAPFFVKITKAPPNVVVWYELCRAEDDTLTQKDWADASNYGAVTVNEVRGVRLGLDPVPWGGIPANSAKALQPMVNLLASVGKGEADPNAASMLLSQFLGIDVTLVAGVLNKGDGAVKLLQARLGDFQKQIACQSSHELGDFFKKQLAEVTEAIENDSR